MKPCPDSRTLRPRSRHDAGFTLIEMMTALAITIFVVAGVLSSFIAQSRVQMVQETVAEGEGNLRAGMELLKRDVRNAGFRFTDANSLVIGNNSGANATDQISVVSSGLGEDRIHYEIKSVGGVTTLIRNTDPAQAAANDVPVIPNAEDLQLAYGWDANGNNAIDAGEWVNNAAGSEGSVSAIRINLVVRAPRLDVRRSNYRRPALEDHAAAVGTDGFPRRVLTTIVEIRNKGL